MSPLTNSMKISAPENRFYSWLILFSFAAALGLRLLLLLTSLNTVNADQAVLGLMGEHILRGHFFIYFWENKYCGAFISYLAAINFKLFGASVLSFKLATFPYVIASLAFTCALAARLYGKAAAAITCLILAISPVYVTLFSVSPHGTYSDTLAFGPAVLYLTYLIAEDKEGGRAGYLAPLLGFLSGVACWISPLITPYLLVCVVVLFKDNKPVLKKWSFLLAASFVLGALPLLIFNIQHPLATFLNLGSRPLDISKAGLHTDLTSAGPVGTLLKYTGAYLAGLPRAFLNTLLAVAGIFKLANPLTEGRAALHALLCAAYLGPVAYYFFKTRRTARENICLYLVAASCLFSFLSFLSIPRFLLPLWPAVAILGGAFLAGLSGNPRRLALLALALVLGVNLAGTAMLSRRKPPPFSELAEYLLIKNLKWGYADYWTAYPLIFLSGEKVIVSPTLQPGAVFPKSKDTYPFYTNQVDARGEVFYLTNDLPTSVALFDARMAALKIKYTKEDFPPFMIYHSFSRRVFPSDLVLPAYVSGIAGQLFY